MLLLHLQALVYLYHVTIYQLTHICLLIKRGISLYLNTYGPTQLMTAINCLNALILKTYTANLYAHHSRVRKQVKLSGSCFSTIYGVGSTQLSETLMSFLCSDIFLTKKEIKVCPKSLLSFYQN